MYDLVLSKEICRLLALDIYDVLIADIQALKEAREHEDGGTDENCRKSA